MTKRIHTNTFTSLTISTMLGGGGQEDLSAAACRQQLCTVDLDPNLVSLSPQTGRGKGAWFSTIQDFLTPSGSCLLLRSREAWRTPLYSLTIGVMIHDLYGLFCCSSIQIFHNSYTTTSINECPGSTEVTVQTRNLHFLMKKCEWCTWKVGCHDA